MNRESQIVASIFILSIVISFIFGLVILNTNKLEDRIEKLEEDYKIYEINLNNLESNKEVQFEEINE